MHIGYYVTTRLAAYAGAHIQENHPDTPVQASAVERLCRLTLSPTGMGYDLTCAAAMEIAACINEQSMDIAEMLLRKLTNDEQFNEIFELSEIAAPGYINLRLSDEGIERGLMTILKDSQMWIIPESNKNSPMKSSNYSMLVAINGSPAKDKIGNVSPIMLCLDRYKRVLEAAEHPRFDFESMQQLPPFLPSVGAPYRIAAPAFLFGSFTRRIVASSLLLSENVTLSSTMPDRAAHQLEMNRRHGNLLAVELLHFLRHDAIVAIADEKTTQLRLVVVAALYKLLSFIGNDMLS